MGGYTVPDVSVLEQRAPAAMSQRPAAAATVSADQRQAPVTTSRSILSINI